MLDLKVFYYGNTRACSQLGSALSSIIAATLVFVTEKYNIIFLATILPYIAALILMITYPKELDGEIKKISSKKIKNFWLNTKQTFAEFWKIFKNPITLKALFNAATFESFFKSSKDYLQPVVKSFVISIPFLLTLDNKKRVAIIIGIVYFFLYILTSLASKNSGYFMRLIKSFTKAVNLTFLVGIVLTFLAGFFYYNKIYYLVILIFVLYYILFNIRKPIMVSYVSDLISSKVMATGLSSESQIKTILIGIFSPILGYLIDNFGLGKSFILFSIFFLLLFFLVRVKEVKLSQ